MADVASKQQTTVLFLSTIVTRTRRHTKLTKKLTNLIGNLCCAREHSVQLFVQFFYTVKLYKLFICPTNTQFNYIKILKFTLRFTINAPTCFGLNKHNQGAYSLCFAKVTILASVKILRYRTVRLCGRILTFKACWLRAPTCLTFKSCTFCPHYMCFVFI
jgi:hypothetical protein